MLSVRRSCWICMILIAARTCAIPSRRTLHAKLGTVRRIRQAADVVTDRFERNGCRFLAERSSSISRARLADELMKLLPNAKWYEHDRSRAFWNDVGRSWPSEAMSGPSTISLAPMLILGLIRRLLDFHANSVSYIRRLVSATCARGRADESRLRVESQFSTLGSVDDHRLPIRSSDVAAFVSHLEQLVVSTATTDGASKTESKHDHEEYQDKFVRASSRI